MFLRTKNSEIWAYQNVAYCNNKELLIISANVHLNENCELQQNDKDVIIIRFTDSAKIIIWHSKNDIVDGVVVDFREHVVVVCHTRLNRLWVRAQPMKLTSLVQNKYL